MVRLTTSDFVVDTVGHCFICMEEMSPQLSATVSPPSSSSIHSMLYLSRYLKIKMRKVFNEKVSISESLLKKVEMSRLKVSLCEECASWNSRLSELLRKLEKIEIEAASYLQLIHGKLERATQDGKSEKLVDRYTDSELMGKLEVAEILRKETMERCSQKLKGAQFKVKVQKLSEKDIEVVKLCKSKSNFETSGAVNSEKGLNDVKWESNLETSNSEGMWESENDYFDNSEERNEGPTKGNISQTAEYNSGSSSSKVKMNLKQNYLRNSRTGKYHCKLCVKTFETLSGFQKHFESSHLKIGFECKICNKEFTQRIHLTIHHKSVHLKLQVKCQFCHKSFTSPTSRRRHIRLKRCKGTKTNSTLLKRQDYSQSQPQDQIDTIKLEVKTETNLRQ